MPAARKTAIVIGILFLVQTVSYLFGDALVRSALDDLSNLSEAQARLGVFLEFVNVAAVIGIGVLTFPILRRFREAMALGYTATKIMEGALLLVSALFALLVLPLGQEVAPAGAADAAPLRTLGALAMDGYDLAFQLAMIALGAGSLLFMYILYKFNLVPRALALLGALGYIALFFSGWLEISGAGTSGILFIPGALFEVVFPFWLIIRGFNESAMVQSPRAGAEAIASPQPWRRNPTPDEA